MPNPQLRRTHATREWDIFNGQHRSFLGPNKTERLFHHLCFLWDPVYRITVSPFGLRVFRCLVDESALDIAVGLCGGSADLGVKRHQFIRRIQILLN